MVMTTVMVMAMPKVKLNVKHYLINHLLFTILGGQYLCLSFPSIDRATAPGGYEQSYLNVKMLTEMFLIPNNISFKDAIRSD
jgi:hypothetical protein